MLAFARKQDLKPEPVSVPELVVGMTDLLQRSLGPQVRIETRFAPAAKAWDWACTSASGCWMPTTAPVWNSPMVRAPA